MAEIFISYANQDREAAARLATALEAAGWSVWWDRKIPPGKSFETVISEAIAAAGCVVVVWSKASVASDWVKDEANEGKDRGILIPISIGNVRAPFGFRQLQAAEMIGWQGETAHEGFRALVRALSDLIGPPTTSKQSSSREPASPRRQRQETKGRDRVKAVAGPNTLKPPEMVVVPAARFRTAWTTEQEIGIVSPNTEVEVAEFSIARSLVTNAEITRFLTATGRLPAKLKRYWKGNEPSEETRDRPALWVPWNIAAAYAEWLGGETGRRFRLPDEDEWERAVTSSDIIFSSHVREWTATTEQGRYYLDLGEESPVYHVVRSRDADGSLVRSAITGAPKASIGFRLASD